MGLQAKYDPGEDRMRLILQAGDGEAHAFWVTRRQWLGLLQALVSLPPVAPEKDAEVKPDATPSRQRQLSGTSVTAPVLLKGIRLRQKKDRARLILVMESDQGVFIDLPMTSIAQLQTILRQQAERAGWDVAAALSRLSSAQLAGAAVRKARLH